MVKGRILTCPFSDSPFYRNTLDLLKDTTVFLLGKCDKKVLSIAKNNKNVSYRDINVQTNTHDLKV